MYLLHFITFTLKKMSSTTTSQGAKATRVRTSETKKTRGKGHIIDSCLFEYALENEHTHVYIHIGQLFQLSWQTLILDTDNNKYTTPEGKVFSSLSAAHKDFAGKGSAVSLETTLRNSYFVKSRDNNKRLKNCLPETTYYYDELKK